MTKVSCILPYYNRKDLIKLTLDSFEYFYRGRDDFEVVIVDDGSSEAHRLEELIGNYKLYINMTRLPAETKTGINPCYPYNVGVRQSTGDVVILSSPETFHTSNVFELADNFKSLDDKTYMCFSTFCTTMKSFNEEMKSDKGFAEKLKLVEKSKPNFYKDLGKNRDSFNNEWGSWYLHSQYRKTSRNFFTAMTKNLYVSLSGFDERFRGGTGLDDDEFLERVLEHTESLIYYDDAVAIHMNHEIVNNLPPTTNLRLYHQTRSMNKYVTNDDWGRL